MLSSSKSKSISGGGNRNHYMNETASSAKKNIAFGSGVNGNRNQCMNDTISSTKKSNTVTSSGNGGGKGEGRSECMKGWREIQKQI
jgi:hypothetical protein